MSIRVCCFTYRIEHKNDLHIIRSLLLKFRLIFLQILKGFGEPLSESNTKRRVFQKKTPNIFIFTFENFTPLR